MVSSEREKVMSELLFVVLFGGIILTATWAEEGLLNPAKLEMFVDELQDMPKIQGFEVINGVSRPRRLKIGMYPIRWKFHRNLPSTPVFAYGTSRSTATVPGPTIEALHGIDTHVTWLNHLPQKHILPWDPTIPTAIPSNRKGIPTVFDHALVVFDRGFRVDGSIYMNSTGNNPSIHPQWQPEYFGDAIIVNGKAWPYMKVRRRKYRFRIINASNARFFQFFFTNGLEFVVVGSDSAYLEEPVKTKEKLLAPSEIVDV
ncbi:hypothetical protein CRG98_035351, partial [Punica granatum]